MLVFERFVFRIISFSNSYILLELFAYFRATPPPEGYGTEFLLPEHLSFPFQSKPDVDRLFIVRHCYQRILSIVNRRLALSYEGGRGSGIIFSGAQGNGKVRQHHCLFKMRAYLMLCYALLATDLVQSADCLGAGVPEQDCRLRAVRAGTSVCDTC